MVIGSGVSHVAFTHFIEEHLNEKICTEEIAEACYCSKSSLEKLFRCVNGLSVRDYLIRRRMTKAAREIAENTERDILTIALNLYTGLVKMDDRHVRYSELFTKLHEGMRESKR